ncbi:hypothetical protein BKA80DRAFT_269297 [Phyllosticta citrichinensis]
MELDHSFGFHHTIVDESNEQDVEDTARRPDTPFSPVIPLNRGPSSVFTSSASPDQDEEDKPMRNILSGVPSQSPAFQIPRSHHSGTSTTYAERRQSLLPSLKKPRLSGISQLHSTKSPFRQASPSIERSFSLVDEPSTGGNTSRRAPWLESPSTGRNSLVDIFTDGNTTPAALLKSATRRDLSLGINATTTTHEDPVLDMQTTTSSPRRDEAGSEDPDAVFLERLKGGMLSDGEIFRILESFQQPDFRFLHIGRSIDDPWAGWTTRFTLKPGQRHVLVPLHSRSRRHWILLHLDLDASVARIYDSLPPTSPVDYSDAARAIGRSLGICWDTWHVRQVDTVRQDGTIDCGIFLLTFAVHILAREPLPTRINPKLWRFIFCHQVLGNGLSSNQLGICNIFQSSLPVDAPGGATRLSKLLIDRLHAAKEEKEQLLELGRDVDLLSASVLGFVAQNDKQIEAVEVVAAAESKSIELRQKLLALAGELPTATEHDANVRQALELSINEVRDRVQTTGISAAEAKQKMQTNGKRLVAGYDAIRKEMSRRKTRSENECTQARVEMEEVAAALGAM